MDVKPEIGIVIPFFNGDGVIRQCLDSISAGRHGNIRVYIVDNSSVETQINQTALAFSFVRVIRTVPSLGFGKACNIGAAAAARDGAGVLVIVNQDTCLATDCLQKMIAVLEENRDIGMVGPINWTINFHEIETTFFRYYLVQSPEFVADAIRKSFKPFYAVGSVMGSCIAIPIQVYKTFGLFDEIYFMYSEDDDLCRRYHRAGLGIGLVAAAHVGHVNSQNSAPDNLEMLRHKRSSSQKYRLKDTSKSFLPEVMVELRGVIFEYIRLCAKGRIGLLTSFCRDDGRLLCQLRQIYEAHRREKLLIENGARDGWSL